MVCQVCRDMLGQHKGPVWKGTLDLTFTHHTEGQRLLDSVQKNCGICRALYDGLQNELKKSPMKEAGFLSLPNLGSVYMANSSFQAIRHVLSWFFFTSLSKIYRAVGVQMAITASLSVHKSGQTYLYRLDMKLQHERRGEKIVVQRTFFLESPKPGDSNPRPRRSSTTSSKEVFDTAVGWLDKCKCSGTANRTFYPSRLISLQNLKHSISKDEDPDTYIRKNLDASVHLVETLRWARTGQNPSGQGYDPENPRYVTLSHCWGDEVNEHHRLNSKNYEAFKERIPIRDLPKTFRDAMYFAAKLDKVGYIWIDSLCIMQDNEDDWVHESSDMNRVYSETYLNISATASSNSEGGLFRRRNPELLQQEKIILNIEGMPGADAAQQASDSHPDVKEYMETMLVQDAKSVKLEFLRSCTILDASLWIERVEEAPVNTRGWVLQERLMSPRVLHFCRDQIAWECLGRKCVGFDAMKQQPHGMSKFRLTGRGVVEGTRLKELDVNTMSDLSALRHWAQIVETYSKTNLTQHNDKLVALSGMARMMSQKIDAEYVAGLWAKNLECQLLWRVEPAFDSASGKFSNPAMFPSTYRAPSFSWASIDVPNHGVIYGDFNYRKILIRVEGTSVTPTSDKNPYGLVTGGYKKAKITLHGKLRPAKLWAAGGGRYAWNLHDSDELDLKSEVHTNVYLDCPARDSECIGQRDSKVFVMPAATFRNGPSSESDYVICLILKEQPERGWFSRIGITKLTPYLDRRATEILKGEIECRILKKWDSHGSLPHLGYHHVNGEHRIRLI